MKIGILGGTFNPPHIGHLILAREVKEKLNLDKIFFIPTNAPPHKENDKTLSSHRLNMIKLAIEGSTYFEARDLEIERGGVSFTIDTVKELKEKFSHTDFYLIIGSELAVEFDTWEGASTLKNLVKIVVAQREICPLKEKDDFVIVDITQVDISSSRIRKMAKEDKPIENFVNKKVADYIRQHNLYK